MAHQNSAAHSSRGRQDVTGRMSSWIDPLGRFGLAAKGAVYILVGVLAAQAAWGSGGATTGSEGAIRRIVQLPFGQVLLVIVGAGLVAYAIWRFVQAIMDTENKGSDGSGLAMRTAYVIVGLVYGALAFTAFGIVFGSGGGDDTSKQEWTAWLLAQPFGRWLVGLIGAGIVAAGLYQFYQAYAAKFRERLKASISRQAERWTVGLGRFGFAARGVVFCIAGGFLILAAIQSDASETRGLGGALDALSRTPYGPWLFAVVAIGLIAYGVFVCLLSRYRRIVID